MDADGGFDFLDAFSVQEVDRQFGKGMFVHRNGCEGGMKFGGDGAVVAANHRQIFWDLEAGLQRSVVNPHGHFVGCGKNRGGWTGTIEQFAGGLGGAFHTVITFDHELLFNGKAGILKGQSVAVEPSLGITGPTQITREAGNAAMTKR